MSVSITDRQAPRRSIARLMWLVVATALVLGVSRTEYGRFYVMAACVILAAFAAPISTAFALFLWLRATDRLEASSGRIRGDLHSLPSIVGALASSLLGLVIGCLIGMSAFAVSQIVSGILGDWF